MKNLFDKKEVAKEFTIAGFMAIIIEIVKGGLKDVLQKKIEKSFKESRGEFFAWLPSLARENKKAFENLRRRQCIRQKPDGKRTYPPYTLYGPGSEDLMVQLLTGLFIAMGEKNELESRKNIFIYLGMLSDEEFDQALEFLNHDVLTQWFNKLKLWVKEVGQEIKELDKKLEPTKDKLENFTSEFLRKRGMKL